MGWRFPDGFVQEVRGAASIVSVVGGYVTLKKAGNSYKGLCPFHSEKTPSFSVNEQRQVYHCFGCGETGDVFRFLMQQERLTFPEAVKRVAELAGVPLPRLSAGPGDERRERLYQLNEKAAQAYRGWLAGAEGAEARRYLERRGLSRDTLERFEIGVSPPGWERVAQPLLRQGYTAEELVAVGLVKPSPRTAGVYDTLHDRIVFPIRNAAGRLVGFGGRSIDGREPKYLNSPETELYSKSDVLYGLHPGRERVRKTGQVVLVEGYLDVMSLHQAGVEEAVASLGTSLTERHARLLSRHAATVVLAYDGDRAGRNASKRALRALLAAGLKVSVVELPAGVDPDDLVREQGAEGFRARLSGARSLVQFLVDAAREEDPGALRSTEGRLRLVNEALPILGALEDAVERSLLAASLAEAAGVEDRLVVDALKRAAAARAPELPEADRERTARASVSEGEAVLVSGLLGRPETARALAGDLDPEDWRSLPSAPILDAILETLRAGGTPQASEILGTLASDPEREILGRILLRSLEPGPAEGSDALRALKVTRLQGDLATLQSQIARTAGPELDALLERKQAISRLLESLR